MIDSDNIQYQTLACLQRAFLFPLEKFVFMLRANQREKETNDVIGLKQTKTNIFFYVFCCFFFLL